MEFKSKYAGKNIKKLQFLIFYELTDTDQRTVKNHLTGRVFKTPCLENSL